MKQFQIFSVCAFGQRFVATSNNFTAQTKEQSFQFRKAMISLQGIAEEGL